MQNISDLCRRFAPAIALLGTIIVASTAQGQLTQDPAGVYYPLDQTAPVGKTALWTAFQGKASPPAWQPIRIQVEGGASVTFFNPGVRPVTAAAPARAAVAVGHLYRLRIADMGELPGVELWPSIEILDRLHPPPGMAETFPVPVQITREEIEMAVAGRMITKVIYLEQPSLAAPFDQAEFLRVTDVQPHINLLAEADAVGRPMMILRLGGRVPDARRLDPVFFGSGAPILLPADPRVAPPATADFSHPDFEADRQPLTAADEEFLRHAQRATPGLKSRVSLSGGAVVEP